MAYYKIRPRSGTANQWRSTNPVLLEREIGYEVPTDGVGKGVIKMKMGDGVTPWNNLPYAITEYLTPDKLVQNATTDDANKIPSAKVAKNLQDQTNNIFGTTETWNNSTSYAVGKVVIYNNTLWKCILANSNQTPSGNSSYWKKVSISELLSDINSLNVALNNKQNSIFFWNPNISSLRDLLNYKTIGIYRFEWDKPCAPGGSTAIVIAIGSQAYGFTYDGHIYYTNDSTYRWSQIL